MSIAVQERKKKAEEKRQKKLENQKKGEVVQKVLMKVTFPCHGIDKLSFTKCRSLTQPS